MKKNKGFTLIELIIVVAIMTVMLGIIVPSLNAIIGFRVQRATNSIAGALDEAKMQAMSRLVGEVELSQDESGCYITYYLHKGKQAGMVREESEQVAPGNLTISYTTDQGNTYLLKDKSLILTYNRENGGFRPIQENVLSTQEVVNNIQNISFPDDTEYCSSIKIKSSNRTRIIKLYPSTGQYEITGE